MQVRPNIRRIAFSLGGGQGEDVEPAAVAKRVGEACRDLDAALTPIIGHKGVEALHKRSLHLAGLAHPWLSGKPPDLSSAEHLQVALSAKGGADAALGGAAFFQAFYDLLTSLLGASLTERLLRTVWIDFLDDTPPQDPVP